MLPKVVLNNFEDDSDALRNRVFLFVCFLFSVYVFIHKSVNFLDLQVAEYVVHFLTILGF